MRLTRAGEYAIRGMIYLANHKSEGLALIPEIAKAQGVSAAFLGKTFQKLVRAGLVESQRGSGGGIALARPAREISLRQIVEAVEGPVAINRCLSAKDPCENSPTCPLSGIWRDAQEKMLGVLDDVTLDRLNGQLHEKT